MMRTDVSYDATTALYAKQGRSCILPASNGNQPTSLWLSRGDT